MLGASLIVAVAAACQVVAPRLRLPALVLLLPAGFVRPKVRWGRQ